jgi:isocitrate/isopropylmalate dehydrogenase
MVLAMFGSIAGAESVLMSLDKNLHPQVAMAEAPHGTAPSLEGKNVANPMAMLLAEAALLDQASLHLDDPAFREAGERLRSATLAGAAAGIRTFDLGGDSTTSGVVDDVIARLRG